MSDLVSVHTNDFCRPGSYDYYTGSYTWIPKFSKNIFNTENTYISICGRNRHAKWDIFVEHCKKIGVTLNVLVDQTAVNYYESHQDEYADGENPHPTRLIVYEFSHIPENL